MHYVQYDLKTSFKVHRRMAAVLMGQLSVPEEDAKAEEEEKNNSTRGINFRNGDVFGLLYSVCPNLET